MDEPVANLETSSIAGDETTTVQLYETPAFVSLAHLVSQLSESPFTSLSALPLPTIIGAAQLFAQLGCDCESLLNLIDGKLLPLALVLHKDDKIRVLRARLSLVFEQCQIRSDDAWAFSRVLIEIASWDADFRTTLAEIDEAHNAHRAAMELLTTLDSIDMLMSSYFMIPFQQEWQRYSKLARDLLTPTTLSEALDVVTPFLSFWSQIVPRLKSMANHYKLASNSVAQQPQTLNELGIELASIASWLESSLAELLKRPPQELPEIPIVGDWLVSPVAEFVLVAELKLASVRALTLPSYEVIDELALLGTGCGSPPQNWITEEQIQIISLLLERGRPESLLPVLRSARQLVGDHGANFLGQAVARISTNRLWRLPESFQNDDSYEDEKQFIALSQTQDSDDIALATKLHVRACCRRTPSDVPLDGLWGDLLQMGPLGAWIFVSYINNLGILIDEELIRRWFCDPNSSELRLEHALALIFCHEISSDGMDLLLASLELLFPPSVDIPFRGVWSSIPTLRQTCPHLAYLLERWAERSPSGIPPLSSDGDGQLATVTSAEKTARERLRPKRYHNVKSFEAVAAEFQREIAEPLFASAMRLQEPHECDLLLARLTETELSIEKGSIERKLNNYAHPDLFRRSKLVEDCKSMITSIRDYTEARKTYVCSRGFGRNRQTLQRELQTVATWGWYGSQASKILHTLLIERKALPSNNFPGDSSIPQPNAWLFPRCLKLWKAGIYDLSQYSIQLGKDLKGPHPGFYAVAEADGGEVAWAQEVLSNVPDITPDFLQQVAERRTLWADLVDASISALSEQLKSLALSEEEESLWVSVQQARRDDMYAAASESVTELEQLLKSPEKTAGQRVMTLQHVHEQISSLLEQLSNAADVFSSKLIWAETIARISRFSSSMPQDPSIAATMTDSEVATINADWAILESQIKPKLNGLHSLEEVSPPTKAPVTFQLKETVGYTKPSEKQSVFAGGSCFGVVKKLAANRSAGFITAFDAELLEETGDVYFGRANCSGDINDIQVGALVELRGVSYAPGYGQPQAKKVDIVPTNRVDTVCRDLQQLIGPFELNIGILSRVGFERLIMTETQGCFPEASGSTDCELGTIVHFDFVGNTNRTALITSSLKSGEVNVTREKLLKKIAYTRPVDRGLSAVAKDYFSGERFDSRWLKEIRPIDFRAIGMVKELSRKVARRDFHTELVTAIKQLEKEPAAPVWWLKAVFIRSFLIWTDRQAQPLKPMLEDLARNLRAWWKGNVDSVAHLLYDELTEFAEGLTIQSATPEFGVGLNDIYQFFAKLQADLLTNPHFRLELNMARISRVQFAQSADPEQLRCAIQHVDRCLVLNPGQMEAMDLLEALRAERSEHDIPSSDTQIPAPRRDNWDILPDDPVDRIVFLQSFYTSPDSSFGIAEQKFREWHPHIQGIARNELVLLHAQLLMNWEKPQQAQDLLLEHIMTDASPEWERGLAFLFQSWKSLRLSFKRIREQANTLEKKIPKDEQYRLYLLLARTAEDQRDRVEARRYAELTLCSRSSTAEAEHLLRRLGFDAALGDDPDAKREQIWAYICDAFIEGTRIEELLLPHLDDTQIGPALAKRAILERTAFDLTPTGRKSLSRWLRRTTRDNASPDLFAAQIEVWGEDFEEFLVEAKVDGWTSRIEAFLDRQLIERLISVPPSDDQLTSLSQKFGLGSEWRGLGCFELLRAYYPSDIRIFYFVGLQAKRAAKTSRSDKSRRTALQIYFESLLLCLGKLPEVSTSWLTAEFTELGWYGLAFAIATKGGMERESLKRCFVQATPQAWQWPTLLCEVRRHQSEDWIHAADAAVRALIAAPDYWGCCQAFFDLFNGTSRENKAFSLHAVQLAKSVVGYLCLELEITTPELLVTEAELLFHNPEVEPQMTWDEVKTLCNDRCHHAHALVQGVFEPARALQVRIEQREQPDYHFGMRVLGLYEILSPCDPGSFGRVYKARTVTDNRLVALKVLKASLAHAAEHEKRRRMLFDEANFLRNITDPHVAKFINYLETPPALVMEWVEGWTVYKAKAQQVRFEWKTVALLARQLVGALRSAYELANRLSPGFEFAHRDIHAANVMIVPLDESSGRYAAKLLDFGLARTPNSLLTSEAKKLATKDLLYRDPEWPEGGLRGDMFSLGVVLYDLLTGRHPYDEQEYREYRDKDRGLREANALEKHLRKQSLPSDCGAFVSILERMVQPSAKARYRDWDELLTELNKLDIQLEH